MDVLSKVKPHGGAARDSVLESIHTPPTKEDIINTLESFTSVNGENKENNNNADLSGKPNDNIMTSGHWDLEENGHSTPASLSHSYSLEWEKLFSRPDMMKYLKQRAVEGELRSSRFRSVVWKLFLEVLTPDKDQWITKTRASRDKFEELKNKLIINPRKAVDSVDITLNNPLSQDEESPWNKFFQDNELRLTIKQDVIRTFPEVEFFRGDEMRGTMMDILFIYSREHASHSYRQGMHELLAPLIFVLHCDHQAYLHACEIESVLTVMKEVMDPAFLEHDAYTMFCQVMETVEPWYLSRDMFTTNPKTGSLRQLELIHATPFARSQDLNPSNAIVTKLTRIQDYVLKRFDPELHQHLERLEIAPQIYGIRWLRLLFGREFPMQDLLMLWDAIFGDGIGFDLVDYIFVAMLMYIRDILLTSDYATCLTILMKYPPVADVHYFVVKATWLREPNQHPRPPNYTHQGPIKTSNSMGGSSDALSMAGSHGGDTNNTNKNPREQDPIGSTVSLSQVEESMYRNMPSASSLARLDMGSNLRSAQSSPGVHHSVGVFPLTPDDVSLSGSPTKSKPRTKPKKLTKTERELQQQVTQLQSELHDKENMCRYCSSKLDVHIGRLQQDLSKSDHIDGEVMVSLAGLKLVRDILSGTLRFSQNITSDEDLAIVDGYYDNRSSLNSRKDSTDSTSIVSAADQPPIDTEDSSKATTGVTSPASDCSDILLGSSMPDSLPIRERGKVKMEDDTNAGTMTSGEIVRPVENFYAGDRILDYTDNKIDYAAASSRLSEQFVSTSKPDANNSSRIAQNNSEFYKYGSGSHTHSHAPSHHESKSDDAKSGQITSKIRSMFSSKPAPPEGGKNTSSNNNYYGNHQNQPQQTLLNKSPLVPQQARVNTSTIQPGGYHHHQLPQHVSGTSSSNKESAKVAGAQYLPQSSSDLETGLFPVESKGLNYSSHTGTENETSKSTFFRSLSSNSGKKSNSRETGSVRELSTIDYQEVQRSRAKSDITGASSYWPDFLSSNVQMPWYSSEEKGSASGRRESSRERSSSQPACDYSGRHVDHDSGVNPLYKIRYPDSMDH